MLLLLPACACISTYMYICIRPCFYDFWHYHPYILQHLNGNVFTLYLYKAHRVQTSIATDIIHCNHYSGNILTQLMKCNSIDT